MSDHVRSCQICNIPQHSARNSPKFSECGVTPEISGGLEEQDLPHVPHVQSRGIHQLDFELVQAGVDRTKLLELPSIECKEFSGKATKGGEALPSLAPSWFCSPGSGVGLNEDAVRVGS